MFEILGTKDINLYDPELKNKGIQNKNINFTTCDAFRTLKYIFSIMIFC